MGACGSKTMPTEPVKKPAPRSHIPSKKSIPKTLKRMVWDTYIGAEKGEALCFCCKHTKIRQIEFHCGHVHAEAHGGATNVKNLRPICAQCNLSMGTMHMKEFMKKFMHT
jgi:hypothetical protein